MTGLHRPECDCATCERLNLGEFAYREIAEELGSDDPAVLDPIWRARCMARICEHEPRSAPTVALCLFLQPGPHHAAA